MKDKIELAILGIVSGGAWLGLALTLAYTFGAIEKLNAIMYVEVLLGLGPLALSIVLAIVVSEISDKRREKNEEEK